MKYFLTSDFHLYCQRVYPDNSIHAGEFRDCLDCKRLGLLILAAGELEPNESGIVAAPGFVINVKWLRARG